MKLFLDSAQVDEVRHALAMWNFDGITTNPRHVQTSGKPFRKVIAEIAEIVGSAVKPISVEVNPHLTDWRAIVDEGVELAKMSPNFVIKVGASEAGFCAVRELSDRGVRTNVTLVFSVAQAWHAARSGASFVSPFLGWKDQFGDDTRTLIEETGALMLDNFDYPTEIIAAAIRNTRQLGDAALAAHCVTAGVAVYQDSFKNPYTDFGNQVFGDAWNKTPTS